MPELPEIIESVKQLEEVMTVPSAAVIDLMKRLDGDIMILGIAGKMGITLGQTALRACRQAGVSKRILGVSRFSDTSSKEQLEKLGIETIACDLLDRNAVDRLPRIKNILYLAGKKFGTDGAEDKTWAMNTVLPANVGHHFRDSRLVVFSTGNVYPLTPVGSGGATEETPVGPVGDYAQSCLGRERVFTYFSRIGKVPMVLYRLCYAIDLRYGVLHDVGQKIMNDRAIDLAMGHVNVIWQGDANCQSLLCLDHCSCPPNLINVTGPETLSVRRIAEEIGKHLGKTPMFKNTESKTALLVDSAKATRLFGEPSVSLPTLFKWTAHWLKTGGESLGKASHFQVRDGKF